MNSYLREGDTYVDVGANIGELVLTASRIIGDSGNIMAIEPHPKIYDYLCGNVALNNTPNAKCICTAVGDRSGQVSFTDRKYSGDPINHILSDTSGTPSIRVPLQRLDDLIDFDRVSLVKIDVEGYELQALRGATETMAKTDCLYVEISRVDEQRYGYSPDILIQYLIDLGYFLFDVRRNKLEEITEYSSDETFSIVAVLDSKIVAERTGYPIEAISR